MQMHPTAGTSKTRIDAGDRRTAALRHMTAEQFLHFGERHLVYMKSGICDGEMLFVLFAADGAPLVAADDVRIRPGYGRRAWPHLRPSALRAPPCQ